MPILSSETLFNFTDTIEHLLSNLEKGIHCHPAIETLPWNGYSYAATICCFCDIPLSMTDEHFDWYGSYGLGVNRSYARKMGLRPVWYVLPESKDQRTLALAAAKGRESSDTVAYFKKFMGEQEFPLKGEGKKKRKKFYDEREWRYVHQDNDVAVFSNNSDANAFNLKSQIPRKMSLDLSQIEYIIIRSSEDLEVLLPFLEKITRSDSKLYQSLVTKILTARQIRKDF